MKKKFTGIERYDTNSYRQLKKRQGKGGIKRRLHIASDVYNERVEAFAAEICKRLIDERLLSGVSVTELAQATNLTTATIYKYEQTRTISMPTFAKVTIALGIHWNSIPLFEQDVNIGREFEYIVQGLDRKAKTKILNEVRAIVGLIQDSRTPTGGTHNGNTKY